MTCNRAVFTVKETLLRVYIYVVVIMMIDFVFSCHTTFTEDNVLGTIYIVTKKVTNQEIKIEDNK